MVIIYFIHEKIKRYCIKFLFNFKIFSENPLYYIYDRRSITNDFPVKFTRESPGHCRSINYQCPLFALLPQTTLCRGNIYRYVELRFTA